MKNINQKLGTIVACLKMFLLFFLVVLVMTPIAVALMLYDDRKGVVVVNSMNMGGG